MIDGCHTTPLPILTSGITGSVFWKKAFGSAWKSFEGTSPKLFTFGLAAWPMTASNCKALILDHTEGGGGWYIAELMGHLLWKFWQKRSGHVRSRSYDVLRGITLDRFFTEIFFFSNLSCSHWLHYAWWWLEWPFGIVRWLLEGQSRPLTLADSVLLIVAKLASFGGVTWFEVQRPNMQLIFLIDLFVWFMWSCVLGWPLFKFLFQSFSPHICFWCSLMRWFQILYRFSKIRKTNM